MPAGLADKLVASFEAPPAAPAPRGREAVVVPFDAAPPAAARAANDEGRRWRGRVALAAAALLGVAIGVGLGRRPAPEAPLVAKAPPPAPRAEDPGRPKTPAEARADLLLRADDLVRIEWAATEDAAAEGTSGDIVWSPSEQRGFMRFSGLATNDPSRSRYQLWIFDETRDERFPVDGGVFDVKQTEVVVPIQAKLPVGVASLFAVTVEPPEGVVVSKRERIVLTAKSAPTPKK